tara:strand:- start:2188 stop:3078 length:891 start_codon:yes stop_codon:yes gene_type:complete
MRATQISLELKKHFDNVRVITPSEIPIKKSGVIFIWLKMFDVRLINSLKSNIHILDILDSYTDETKSIISEIDDALHQNIFDGIIVNSKYMANYFRKNIGYKKRIYTIYHHWDPILSSIKVKNQNRLSFGYLGCLTGPFDNNFTHGKRLVEDGIVKTLSSETKVKNSNTKLSQIDPTAFGKIVVDFNCHFSIRAEKRYFNFKTTAKLATAAALNHNIITTSEKSTSEILPNNYPFLLENSEFNTVMDMVSRVKKDYYDNRILWNQGLSMMEEVKHKLSIGKIILKYVELIDTECGA